MDDDQNELFPGLPEKVLGLTDIDAESLISGQPNRSEVKKRLAKAKASRAPLSQISIWSGIALDVTMLDAESLEHEVEVFAASGQREPVIVRSVADGYEAIGRAYLAEVVRAFNVAHPDNKRDVEIEIRDIDDEAAFRLVASELEVGPDISSFERGRFYQRAIEAFESEAAFARECGVHKATISRNLDTVRVLDPLGQHILIHRDIAQADATWFMSVWGRSDGSAKHSQRSALAKAVARLGPTPLPAKQVFGRLRAALGGERSRKGEAELTYGGKKIGMIRRTNASTPIQIVLDKAGEVELDALMEVLRTTIERVRRAQTI